MTEAEAAIAELDAALAEYGRTVKLRRLPAPNTPATAFDCDCKSAVRNYTAAQLVGGIIQGDSIAVLSPTDLKAGSWPGTAVTSDDDLVPRKGDKLLVGGRPRNVEAAIPFFVGPTLVRIELQIRG